MEGVDVEESVMAGFITGSALTSSTSFRARSKRNLEQTFSADNLLSPFAEVTEHDLFFAFLEKLLE
jgi:hypothetical protein